MSAILLERLLEGIDEDILSYLSSDPELKTDIEGYLLELLVNDDLLSTETFKTTTSTKRTLIEEIAELDLQLRDINIKLSKITNDNRDLIIDINDDLHQVQDLMKQLGGTHLDNMLQQTSKPYDLNITEKMKNSVKTSNSVLTNIDSILDLLELPTLCRVCVVQGNYQEALEISHLAKLLMIRFPKLDVFKDINKNVEEELQMMVKSLIKLLNSNLKQSQILKIFQILNKLDLVAPTVSRAEKERFLKSLYINSRFKFIINEISHLRPLLKANKLTYLKRYVEIYREHIFNSLSIYYAIFSTAYSQSREEREQQDTVIIANFIKELALLLVAELKKYLPEILTVQDGDDADIDLQALKDGLILQLIYLCKSLSKYQVDFEIILVTELCFGGEPALTESDWKRNLSKIKKFR